MLIALAGASAMTLAAGAASAQDRGWYGGNGWNDSRGTWMSIDRRQQQLDMRIDRGLRNGQLNRSEAMRLRAEFRDIARLERRYRANGLSNWERADLDRRFDRLAMAIRFERRDRDYGYGYGYDRR
jgi:hypothetical protein